MGAEVVDGVGDIDELGHGGISKWGLAAWAAVGGCMGVLYWNMRANKSGGGCDMDMLAEYKT